MKPYQLQKLFASSNQSGFTIIESLVALLVAGILLAAVAPVLVLATATRVQGRRVELATQAAKAFVDGVQTKTISDPPISTQLDPATSTTPRTLSGSTSDYLLSGASAPSDKTSLYCFNKDGTITGPNCTSDLFYIQAIRLAVTGSDPDQGQGYRLGIRVYRSDANISSSTPLTTTASANGQKQSPFTTGLGNRQAPLVEMTTEIVRGQPSYTALCARLGGCS